MRVAILGAGMSGLSCAITLEHNGIEPVIYEKRRCVGDRFVNAEALFSILDRPIKDSLTALKEEYGICLTPVETVSKLYIHSKNAVGSIDGRLGYTNIRGRHPDSFENQLAGQVKSRIYYETDNDVTELAAGFDRVVLATGDAAYAAKLENYRCDLTISLRGATVEGVFHPDMPHVWFNYDILPKGYGWLIPFSATEAHLVIAYPDYPENRQLDITEQWNIFFNFARKDLGQELRVTDRFQVTHYIAGICDKPKLQNIYFTGNCFGALSPGLGFGQLSSVLTGVFAAQDICGLGDYEALVQPLFENYNHSLVLRRFLERLSNHEFDLLVKSMDLSLLKALNTYIFSSDNSFNLLKWLTPFIK